MTKRARPWASDPDVRNVTIARGVDAARLN